MRRWHFIIPLLLMILVSACERVVEFPIEPSQGRLYLECFPSNGNDTTYIKLIAARPITEFDSTKTLDNIRISFSVNGKPMTPVLLNDDNSVYTYFISIELNPGDEIEINAVADGYCQISSASRIMDGDTMEMSRVIINNSILRHIFTIRRERDLGEKHYYGISIEGERRLEKTYADPEIIPETSISTIHYDYNMKSPVVFPDKEVLGNETIRQCTVNGKNMVVFEDDGGATQAFDVYIDIPFEADKYRAILEEYTVFRRTLYNVKYYKIPKSAYEYLNPQANKYLMGAGLTPPYLSYVNINGGYGIHSCMSCTSTGWIANLESN